MKKDTNANIITKQGKLYPVHFTFGYDLQLNFLEVTK